MPKGSKVGRCYDKLAPQKGKASAAKICQSSTGQSLRTGKQAKGARAKAKAAKRKKS